MWGYPFFHGAYAYAVNGGEFGEGAGLDLGCLDCAGHDCYVLLVNGYPL